MTSKTLSVEERAELAINEQTESVLKPIRDDIAYVAEIIRKYGIVEENYDPTASLQNLVGKGVALEPGEKDEFSRARERIRVHTQESGVSLGVRVRISGLLPRLYFGSEPGLLSAG